MNAPANQTPSTLEKKLLANFRLKGTEFYDQVRFSGGDIGFSVKKQYKNKDNPISLFKVAITRVDMQSDQNLLPLFVSAAYGELSESGSGISIRGFDDEGFRRQPIDIQSRDDYWYNKADGKVYKNSARIDGLDLLREVAKAHAAQWRTVQGISTRLRLEFWKLFGGLLRLISDCFGLFLLAISGIRYSYDPIMAAFEEEDDRLDGHQGQLKASTKTGNLIEFLGYKASAWSVLFYCFLHLFLFVIFFELDLKPKLIVTMLKNNFLTVAYVISSLWLIERAVPGTLKTSIKYLSTKAYELKYHKVRINL